MAFTKKNPHPTRLAFRHKNRRGSFEWQEKANIPFLNNTQQINVLSPIYRWVPVKQNMQQSIKRPL